jgi:predicted SAM-dependent methyltransferase
MPYALPAMGPKVIELGGGAHPMFHPNVDVRACLDESGQPTVDFTADFEEPLPITSEEWDGVFAKYVIEHLSWRKVAGFVAELHRITRPGGCVVVVTANGEAQMRWALRQDWDEKISQCLGGDQDFEDNTHKVFFNPAWIARLFRAAGFGSVVVVPFGITNTDMIVEARR